MYSDHKLNKRNKTNLLEVIIEREKMLSRLNHRSSPTEIPSGLLIEISEALNIQYKNKLDPLSKEIFSVNAFSYANEIILIVSLSKPNSIKNMNIYASIDYPEEKTSINEAIYYLVDSVGFFLDDFFKSKRTTMLPETWKAYNINERKVYLKSDNVNLILEKLADNFLNKEI